MSAPEVGALRDCDIQIQANSSNSTSRVSPPAYGSYQPDGFPKSDGCSA